MPIPDKSGAASACMKTVLSDKGQGRFCIFVTADAARKSPYSMLCCKGLDVLAERKGLEPSASGVTGRRYNRLNYRSVWMSLGRTSCAAFARAPYSRTREQRGNTPTANLKKLQAEKKKISLSAETLRRTDGMKPATNKSTAAECRCLPGRMETDGQGGIAEGVKSSYTDSIVGPALGQDWSVRNGKYLL